MPVRFSDLGYGAKKKQTRRDRFPTQLEALTPWVVLAAAIEPFYLDGRGAGCHHVTEVPPSAGGSRKRDRECPGAGVQATTSDGVDP